MAGVHLEHSDIKRLERLIGKLGDNRAFFIHIPADIPAVAMELSTRADD